MDPRTRADSGTAEALTRQEVSRRLGCFNPFVQAETWRPWSSSSSQELDRPLLRIWDVHSGSQPEEDGRMLSRAPYMLLDTPEARKGSLALNLNNSNWGTPTPYISFTKSATAIDKLVHKRAQKGNRREHTLTVIDPGSRVERGLPTLDVAAEMEHYSIVDPYDQGNQYYVNHYVCLWEVTPKEIVDHWEWKEWADDDNWYENIVMPAFRKFRDAKSLTAIPAPAVAPAPAPASAFDLSSLEENLPGQFSDRVI